MTVKILFKASELGWQQTHLGRLLGHALRRFDERVFTLMAHSMDVPLALCNLAARGQVTAAHIHITRHAPVEGARLVVVRGLGGRLLPKTQKNYK